MATETTDSRTLPSSTANNILFHLVPLAEELRHVQKVWGEFTYEMKQLQSRLDQVQREKSVVQSKAIEMERMHVQMKEAMNADINYLRHLNLQFVEQQMKGTCSDGH